MINKILQKLNNKKHFNLWPGLIQKYKSWLPITENTPIISLQEGGTPLLELTEINKFMKF